MKMRGIQGTKKPKSKKAGKKEEKEKEFKLEILVRTVSFLQNLIKRVAVLEEGVISPPPCPTCAGSGVADAKKRKRSHLDEIDRQRSTFNPNPTTPRSKPSPSFSRVFFWGILVPR